MSHYRTIAAVIAAGLSATAASPDVVEAWYVHQFSFSYEVAWMPDLDQRRYPGSGVIALPGDGNMYCVPTSAMNLLAYAANHGFPQVSPFPNDWSHPGTYNLASLAIDQMGGMMGTHPTNGTGAGGWTGFLQWIGWHDLTITGDSLDVNAYYIPSLAMLAQRGVNGGICQMVYGRYDAIDSAGDPLILDDRTGGHAVSMTEAKYIATTRTLGVRDPADEPDIGMSGWQTTQSPFTTKYYDVTSQSVRFQCFFPDCIRSVTALGWSDGDSTMRVIDGIVTVNPKAGYEWVDSGGEFEVRVYTPRPWWGSINEPLQIIPMPFPDPVCVIMDHDQLGFYAVEFGQVYHVNRMNGDVQDLPIPADVECVAMGRQRQMYTYGDGLLRSITTDHPDWEAQAQTFTPDLADAIAFDDATDQLVVLSREAGALFVYGKELPADGPTWYMLPASVPLVDGMCLATAPDVDGNNARWWVGSPTANTLWGFTDSGDFVEIDLPPGSTPTSISFDDAGHLHAVVDGQVLEYRYLGLNEWGMLPAEESFFTGQAVSGPFQVTRSRTNFNPELHSGPGWHNIHPDELEDDTIVIDCNGDLNDDRVVDVADLLQILGDWGPCTICLSDVNGDRVIDVSDMLVVLANWGSCD